MAPPEAPWVVIDANDSAEAQLNALQHLLDTIPYEHEEERRESV
ncbi:MAG: hypothetical protein AAF492_01735 [Verrucomicrobiota bacterium]